MLIYLRKPGNDKNVVLCGKDPVAERLRAGLSKVDTETRKKRQLIIARIEKHMAELSDGQLRSEPYFFDLVFQCLWEIGYNIKPFATTDNVLQLLEESDIFLEWIELDKGFGRNYESEETIDPMLCKPIVNHNEGSVSSVTVLVNNSQISKMIEKIDDMLLCFKLEGVINDDLTYIKKQVKRILD